MKFYCVTPCLNAENYIEETMLSVLTQTIFEKQNFFLFYIIADGGSVDGTVEIIERIISQFSNNKNMRVSYFSEKDSGMYDALAKGFENEINSSDVYSYINAGDYYSKHAFDIVSSIFIDNCVHFITGVNCVYNEKSHLTGFSLPFSYNRNLLQEGLYGTILPFVQQESTFWSNKLHKKINLSELRGIKLAGDYYLWKTFITDEPLYVVYVWLSGFKKHGGLSSKFIGEYRKEMKSLSSEPTIFHCALAYIHKVIWRSSNRTKRKLSAYMFVYDHTRQVYRPTKRSRGRLHHR